MTIESSLITVGIHSAGCFVDCCSESGAGLQNYPTTNCWSFLMAVEDTNQRPHAQLPTNIKIEENSRETKHNI